MKNNNYSIGVFDSGLGGLTVLRELKELMPFEKFIYFGDTAHIPYGNKSKGTVEKYCLDIINFLQTRKIKLIIVACNTASSVALKKIKAFTQIPIIDVVSPCVMDAISKTKKKRVGIIGTETTIKSKSYQKQINTINKDIKIFSKACPLFVPVIEEGATQQKFVMAIAKFYLSKFNKNNIDVLILGCTHYPMIKEIIKNNLSPKIKIIDSAHSTAQYVNSYIHKHQIKSFNKKIANDEYFVSDKMIRFHDLANMFLKQQIKNIQQINL